MTLDEFTELVANDEDLREKMVDRRGGCDCCISPPCHACTDPLSEDEAEALGWEKPFERPVKMRDWRLS